MLEILTEIEFLLLSWGFFAFFFFWSTFFHCGLLCNTDTASYNIFLEKYFNVDNKKDSYVLNELLQLLLESPNCLLRRELERNVEKYPHWSFLKFCLDLVSENTKRFMERYSCHLPFRFVCRTFKSIYS